MGSSSKSPIALFIVINLVLFAAVASADSCSLLRTTGILPLSVCGLTNVIGLGLGGSCCTTLSGLTDLDAAVCLCAAINANVFLLGIGVDATVYITATLASCGRTFPSGYTCST